MNNKVFRIDRIRKDIVKKEKNRILDAQASYICLEGCLMYLNMNQMPELAKLKIEIKKIMKELVEIGTNV